MNYKGKQTTYAGTFIKSQVITPSPDAEWKVSRVLITTNEQPNKKPSNNYMGWLSSTDEVLEYYSKTSKAYKLTRKTLLYVTRKKQYVNVVDATCSYTTTENLEQRL